MVMPFLEVYPRSCQIRVYEHEAVRRFNMYANSEMLGNGAEAKYCMSVHCHGRLVLHSPFSYEHVYLYTLTIILSQSLRSAAGLKMSKTACSLRKMSK